MRFEISHSLLRVPGQRAQSRLFVPDTAAEMAAITSSCAALRPAGVRVSAPRQARSRVVVAVAKTEVSLRVGLTVLMHVFFAIRKHFATLKPAAFGTV